MTFEMKPNTGSLFRVEDRKSDTHPEYSGSALIEGVEYFVDAWVNEVKSGAKAGKKYFSFKFKPKQQSGGSSRQQTQSAPIDDSGVPF
jgi:hypothetical protein